MNNQNVYRIWLISNPAVAFTISDEMGMFGSIMQLHKTVKKNYYAQDFIISQTFTDQKTIYTPLAAIT